MERAHGRHQADRAARARVRRQRRAQLGDGAHGPHAGTPAGERPGALDELVEEGQQLGGGLGHRGALALHGGLVAAGDRPGERRARGRARPSSRPCGARAGPAARGPRRGRGPAPPATRSAAACERDQEVGGDRGGGVVGGAAGVVDLERAHAQRRAASRCASASASGVGAGHRAARAREGLGALAAGEGLERVQPEGLGAGRGERRERRGAAGVADERRGAGHGGGGRRRSRRRARRAATRRRRPVLAAAGGAARRHAPACAKRGGQGGAQAAGPDHAQAQARGAVIGEVHRRSVHSGSGRQLAGRRVAVSRTTLRSLMATPSATVRRRPSSAASVTGRSERREELVELYQRGERAARRCPLHEMPHPGGVRQRQRRRRPDVRGRGARMPRGPAGAAVRGPGGPAAGRAAARGRAEPRRGLHHERPEDRGRPAIATPSRTRSRPARPTCSARSS